MASWREPRGSGAWLPSLRPRGLALVVVVCALGAVAVVSGAHAAGGGYNWEVQGGGEVVVSVSAGIGIANGAALHVHCEEITPGGDVGTSTATPISYSSANGSVIRDSLATGYPYLARMFCYLANGSTQLFSNVVFRYGEACCNGDGSLFADPARPYIETYGVSGATGVVGAQDAVDADLRAREAEVGLVPDEENRLDLIWYGVWVSIGVSLVALVAPTWRSVFAWFRVHEK